MEKKNPEQTLPREKAAITGAGEIPSFTTPPESAAELEKLQHNRLIKLLRYTLRHSDFYREYYRHYGITEKNLVDITLADIPVVSKTMLMDHYDSMVCDKNLKKAELETFIADPAFFRKKYRGIYRVCQTSGSTGRPALFVYGKEELNLVRAIVEKYHLREAPRRLEKIRIAGYMAINGHYAGLSTLLTMPAERFDIRFFSVNAPLPEVVTALNAFQPHALSGYSSAMDILAREQLQGNLSISPRQITCGGDHLTRSVIKNCREAFKIIPKNTYGCTQSLALSATCSHGKIHLVSDWNIPEILDENLHPVPGGKEGRLYLTCLYNYTQPLIRYDTCDRLVLGGNTCSCHSVFPVLEQISGRNEEFLWFKKRDGSYRFIHPIVLVVFFVPGLKRFQIIQGGNNDLLVNVELANPALIPLVEKKMYELLEENELIDSVSLRVNQVEKIANDPVTGKFRLIVPYNQ